MKILVVEDEHLIANSIKKGLEQEKMVVDVVYDGNDGLDMALNEDYDVVILDRLLPNLSGTEITSKLREKGNHTPILILTALGTTTDKVEGLNLGADDYLVKPFAFEELLARLHALKRRPQEQVGQVLKIGDLTLDTITYQVRRGGKEIQLSNREFTLLEYFMRHPNQTLSKEQIIQHVWDYDSEVLPNTVEVFIGYLRSKVDAPFKKPLLQTVRGFGYRIGEN